MVCPPLLKNCMKKAALADCLFLNEKTACHSDKQLIAKKHFSIFESLFIVFFIIRAVSFFLLP